MSKFTDCMCEDSCSPCRIDQLEEEIKGLYKNAATTIIIVESRLDGYLVHIKDDHSKEAWSKTIDGAVGTLISNNRELFNVKIKKRKEPK